MSGKIVTVVNRKGGVGKTTLTLGLADTFVEHAGSSSGQLERCVVAVDLDPQASLTRALLSNVAMDVEEGRLGQVLGAGRTLAAAVDQRLSSKTTEVANFLTHGVGRTGYHFSLLANDARGWDVERKGFKRHGEAKLGNALSSLLEQLSERYEYVLIDCPPGQTILAEAAIKMSNLILCPISPDYLSIWGLESFDAYMRELFPAEAPKRPPARFVFTKWRRKPTRYDPQDKLSEYVESFSEPSQYVTLLREVGGQSSGLARAIKMPFDPKLVLRLEGSPKPGRIWPFQRSYTADTVRELVNLGEAVKMELRCG